MSSPGLADACLAQIARHLYRYDSATLEMVGTNLAPIQVSALIKSSAAERTIGDTSLLALLSGGQITQLSCGFCDVRPEGLEGALPLLGLLKLLRVNGMEVTDKTLQQAAASCPQLSELRLYGCSKFGDAGLEAFAAADRSCRLTCLDISMNDAITGASIRAVCVHAAGQLRELSLAWSQCVDDSVVADIGKHCPLLEVLVLARCPVTDDGLTACFEAMSGRLRLLDVSGNSGLVGEYLEVLAETCGGSLTNLNISENFNTDGTFFATAVAQCTQLARLDLCECIKINGANTGLGLAASAAKLEWVDLSGLPLGDGRMVCGMLGTASKLEQMYCNDLRKLSDAGMDLLAPAATAHVLKTIELRGARRVSEAAFVRLLRRCGGTGVEEHPSSLSPPASSSLRRLDLSWNAIGDDTMVAVGQSCPQLRELSIPNCTKVGDVGLRAIGLGCPGLVELDLEGCSEISDAAIVALVNDTSSALRKLRLQDCNRLTDASVEAIARGCPRLRILLLSGCHRITSKSLSALNEAGLPLREVSFGAEQEAGGVPGDDDGKVAAAGRIAGEITTWNEDDILAFCREHAETLVSLSLQGTPLSAAGVAAVVKECAKMAMLCCAGQAQQTREEITHAVKDVLSAEAGGREGGVLKLRVRVNEQGLEL